MNATLLLAIATLALAIGPLLERVGRRLPVLAAVIDGATVGAIVTVAALHLMPEAGAHIKWWALVLFLIGLLLPAYTERIATQSWQGWRVLIGLVVAVLFIGHLLVEGAALASTASNERVALATLFAVASHNLPVGAVLWGHTKRRFGAGWSALVLIVVGAATWFGPLVIPVEPGVFSGVCSALLAGGLVHLVVQHSTPLGHHRDLERRELWSGFGAVAAVFALTLHLALGDDGHAGGSGEHAHGLHELPGRFFELLLETAPALLAGIVGAALIEAFLPEGAVRLLARGSRLRQAVSGVVIGGPMPVCSCGVLPIYRSLVGKGVPATAALALLVAAPEIGLDSLLLSWQLLGWPTTIARFSAALLLALAVGWIVGRVADRAPARPVAPGVGEARQSAWRSIERGFFETWAHLAPWVLVGLYATVLFEPWIDTEWARELPGWAQILALSALGMPTYICAAAATPFAALLLIKGFAPGAVIAFLLIGPATNLTTVGALRRLHSRAVAWAFVVVVFAATFVLGLAIDWLLPRFDYLPPHELHTHDHGAIHVVSVVVLLALTVWIVLRSGPRAFLGQLRPEAQEHEHVHGAGACEHAHASSGR